LLALKLAHSPRSVLEQSTDWILRIYLHGKVPASLRR
jgi:hypothetical protein